MLYGIDVSSWQGAINVADMQLDFVISKATQGTNYTNPCCDGVIQQCRETGKKWGFYHFAEGGNPTQEADYFVDECQGYFGSGIPVLDFEADAIGLWGVEGSKEFLDRVQQRTGVKPLIYMSESVCTYYDWSSVANADYGLWCARYPDIANPTFYEIANVDVALNTGAWEFAAIWQFASDTRVSGYDGDLDGNVAFMDASAWDAYAGTIVPVEFHDEQEVRNSETFESENLKITVEYK